ncbi:hypothetical protein M1555_00445 [Patescibacteria group bacterium]|nr:hypothetical protein [Patescibacteria group bacterium]
MNRTVKFLAMAFAVILVAALPRAIELVNGNYLWGFDQGLFYEAVRRIVVGHKLTLIGAPVGGQGGLFQGPGWYYLLAVPFLLTGGDPYGGMTLMFAIGMSVVLLGMWFGVRTYGRVTGLVIGLFLATSPALIAQSRFIWPPFPVSLLSLGVFICLYHLFSGRRRALIGAFFLTGTMFHFEAAAGATLAAVLFATALIAFIRKHIDFRTILAGLTFLLLPLTPLVVFDIRHDFITSRALGGLFMARGADHGSGIQMLSSAFVNHAAVFWAGISSSSAVQSVPVLFAVFLLLVSALYIRDGKIARQKKVFVLWLLGLPVFLYIVFAPYVQPIWDWWIIELTVSVPLLSGILLGYLFEEKKLRLAAVLVTVVIAVTGIGNAYTTVRRDFSDFGGTHKIQGKEQAIDALYKDAGYKPFHLMVFTPAVYTYAYDYLFGWYGTKRYGFVPAEGKSKTFYLLIEPDPEKPWSYKGWLETVIKTGTVVSTKTLPSGFIIQKRMMPET